jgi:hypothetical protein
LGNAALQTVYVYNPIIPSRNVGPLRGFSIRLFLAVCLISFQDFPMIFASSSTVLLHATSAYLVLGCLVDSSPKLVVLFRWAVYEVYGPYIHPHFRRQISISIPIWLEFVHRSLLDIWTGQNVREILRSHLLIKTCNCVVLTVYFCGSRSWRSVLR